jgi:replication initiation and membrane attachment protein
LLHFTEHHRFSVYRDFALSVLQESMLTLMYQPIVGMAAVGLYYTLYRQVGERQAGYSPLEQHRRLLLLSGSEGEAGRRDWIELTSRLEAVGLLRTERHYAADGEEYVYVYRMSAPLEAAEFFRNQHLTLLLRDKIGKYMLLALKSEMTAAEPAELSGTQSEDLSMPFYELFRLNTYAVDPELEQALEETAAAAQTKASAGPAPLKGFDYAEIIGRFPRSSRNRPFVENLKFEKEQLAAINYVVRKYGLGLAETCRLLNEDDVFREDGTLDIDFLQHKANLDYLQGRRREEQRTLSLARAQEAKQEGSGAVGGSGDSGSDKQEQTVEMAYYLEVPELLQGKCDVHQYNFVLRNEPYTDVVKYYFTGGVVPTGVLDMLGVLNLTYKLNEEVLNVLLHYSHVTRRSWSRSSLEQVASDMLGRQIETYEQAVQFVRERLKLKLKLEAKEKAVENGAAGARGGSRAAGAAGRGRSSGGGSGAAGAARAKPQIPVARPAESGAAVSPERLEEIRRKAKKLDEVFNNRKV